MQNRSKTACKHILAAKTNFNLTMVPALAFPWCLASQLPFLDIFKSCLWHWVFTYELYPTYPSSTRVSIVTPWTYTFHRQAMLNRTTRILKPIASCTRFHGETIKMLWLKRSCYDLKRSQRFHAKTRPLQWLKTKCYDLTLPLVPAVQIFLQMGSCAGSES